MNHLKHKPALTSWFFPPTPKVPVSVTSQPECQFQVRAAIPADLTDVSQIIAESFHSQNGIWGWTFPLLRLGIYEDLRHRLASASPHHVCLVAIDKCSDDNVDNLVATVELSVRFNDSWRQPTKNFPYLSNLAVSSNYRRQGAASNLLTSCEKLSREWGFEDLYLHVLENNHQARQLYFKLGYKVYQVESNWNTLFFRRSRQILLHKRLQE